MPLAIPTNRAFRSVVQLQTLVKAVRDAPASEQEDDWIDWKRAEKLTARSCVADIAHHVIGFANRDPGKAALVAEGTAYLLIGVEPGHLENVEVIDIATLQPALLAYLGTNGPGWRADYVEVGGCIVLVITTEAPQWGDRIHTLRKTFRPQEKNARAYDAGMVYIRRAGRTENHPIEAEWEMLMERLLRRNAQLQLDLEWSPPGTPLIVALDISAGVLRPWLVAERERCLKSVIEAERQRDFLESPMGIHLNPSGYSASLLSGGERRTPNEYREEVDKYLRDAEQRLPGRAWASAVEEITSDLQLTLVNNTNQNFSDVQVEIFFCGAVTGYIEPHGAWEGIGFLRAPEPYGTDQSPLTRYGVNIPYVSRIAPPLPRAWAENVATGCRIMFAPVDVRPGPARHVPLPTFRLLARAEAAGTTMNGSWYATAKNVNGRVSGTVEIHIDSTVISAGTILAPSKTG